MAPPEAEKPSAASNIPDTHSNLSSFLQRMYNPAITRGLESRMPYDDTNLLHVPWKLELGDDHEKRNDAAYKSDGGATNDTASAAATPSVYPPMNYLELRRIQNNEWATDRLKEGIRLATEGKSAKAEECYKEGLDLAPTHAELFVAYGALCANLGRIEEAVDKLHHALELDPKVANAQAYIDAITKRVPPRQAGSLSRSETAMNDALMERSFLRESRASLNNQSEKYSLVYEEKVDANSDNGREHDRSKRKHHRHKKDKRRSSRRDRSRHRKSRSRRKRHTRRGFSSDDASMGDASDSGRWQRHRRRPSTDETSEESYRRRRRHRKRHKRRRRYSSDSSLDTSNDGEHSKGRQTERRRSPKRKRSGEMGISQERIIRNAESQETEKVS